MAWEVRYTATFEEGVDVASTKTPSAAAKAIIDKYSKNILAREDLVVDQEAGTKTGRIVFDTQANFEAYIAEVNAAVPLEERHAPGVISVVREEGQEITV